MIIIPFPVIINAPQARLPVEGNFPAFIEAHLKLAAMRDTSSYSKCIFAMLRAGEKKKNGPNNA